MRDCRFLHFQKMLKRKLCLLFLLLIFMTTSSVAQKILVIDSYKLFGFKRIRYSAGDEISFKLNDFKEKYKGEILAINDSVVFLKGMDVPLKTIDAVYRDRGNFLTRDLSKFFMWAGLGFIVLDTGNNLVTKSDDVIEQRAVVAGGSLMLVGFTMKLLSIKKYKIGNMNALKVIDVSMKEN